MKPEPKPKGVLSWPRLPALSYPFLIEMARLTTQQAELPDERETYRYYRALFPLNSGLIYF